MYYLQSRYYNPERDRFINVDTQLNMDDGVLGANMFAYCMNNPVNMTDSSGHCPFWNGVKDFFVGQWNTIKQVVTHPIQSYKSYVSDPWNYFSVVKILRDEVKTVAGMWKDIETGNWNSLAYGTGQRAGATAEVLVTLGAVKVAPKVTAKINTYKLGKYISNPQTLKNVSPEYVKSIADKAGFETGTLSKGVHAGQGFKVTWGGDRLLQFHPGGGHHGANSYWKASSGSGGTVRIFND